MTTPATATVTVTPTPGSETIDPRKFAVPTGEAAHGIFALGHLVSIMGQDPRYRNKVLGLIREANPGLPIPELDVQTAVEARLHKVETDRTAREKELADRVLALEAGTRRSRWAAERDLDDEDMAELEKFAKEKKIGDPDAALDYYQRTDLGRPRSTGGVVAMTAESRKELFRNPKEWAMREGQRVLQEVRSGRGRRRRIA